MRAVSTGSFRHSTFLDSRKLADTTDWASKNISYCRETSHNQRFRDMGQGSVHKIQWSTYNYWAYLKSKIKHACVMMYRTRIVIVWIFEFVESLNAQRIRCFVLTVDGGMEFWWCFKCQKLSNFFTTFGNKIREFSTFQWCMSYGVVFCPSMNKGCCTCSWLCNVKHRDMHCRLIVSLDKLARPRNC